MNGFSHLKFYSKGKKPLNQKIKLIKKDIN